MQRLLSFIFISIVVLMLSGCDDQVDRAGGYSNTIGDLSGANGYGIESLTTNGELDGLMAGDALSLAANDGTINIDTNAFGGSMGGGMGGMGDIESLMGGKESPPKKYTPRFIMMGEVNATIDGKFYRFASVYDNQQEVPSSKFMYDSATQKFIVQVVGVQVWEDKLVPGGKRIVIKFPLTPLGKDPFMQQTTVSYPTNVQSMVKTGGRPFYWGYLMGGGGYWVTMDENNMQHMTQFAFGAFVLPSKN